MEDFRRLTAGFGDIGAEMNLERVPCMRVLLMKPYSNERIVSGVQCFHVCGICWSLNVSGKVVSFDRGSRKNRANVTAKKICT